MKIKEAMFVDISAYKNVFIPKESLVEMVFSLLKLDITKGLTKNMEGRQLMEFMKEVDRLEESFR